MDGPVLFNTAAGPLFWLLSVSFLWIVSSLNLFAVLLDWQDFCLYCCLHCFHCWSYYLREEVGHGLSFLVGLGRSRWFFWKGLSLLWTVLLGEGGSPSHKRARPDWWYAPGTAGLLNLGVAVCLDWDQFISGFSRLCWICPHGFVLWSEPARHLVAPFFSHYPWWGYLFGLWQVFLWYDSAFARYMLILSWGMGQLAIWWRLFSFDVFERTVKGSLFDSVLWEYWVSK